MRQFEVKYLVLRKAHLFGWRDTCYLRKGQPNSPISRITKQTEKRSKSVQVAWVLTRLGLSQSRSRSQSRLRPNLQVKNDGVDSMFCFRRPRYSGSGYVSPRSMKLEWSKITYLFQSVLVGGFAVFFSSCLVSVRPTTSLPFCFGG